MIIFYGEGRLGNQVFQYQALCHMAKATETIYSIGLEDLPRVFDLFGPSLFVLTRNGLLKRITKYLFIPILIRPLARICRLINYVAEPHVGTAPHCGPSGEMHLRRGLLKHITFVDGGFYQNGSLWTQSFPARQLRLKTTLRDAASNYLQSITSTHSMPFFVHVRRGDYLGYSSYGLTDLTLPMDFYRRAMKLLNERYRQLHLVFVTDDVTWVTEHFKDIRNKSIASFSADLDFAIMTQCRGGILSNSTFALAAGFMLDQPEAVIAPQYWFGFRVKCWFPPRIQVLHDRLSYIPVLT